MAEAATVLADADLPNPETAMSTVNRAMAALGEVVKTRPFTEIKWHARGVGCRQFSTKAGKVCPSPAVDCFDRIPVPRRIDTSPNADLANSMLENACADLSEGEHPVCHSDRSCHRR